MAPHREGGEVNLMRFRLRCVLHAEEVSKAQTLVCNRKEAIRIPLHPDWGLGNANGDRCAYSN
jgi:hypothetical protein